MKKREQETNDESIGVDDALMGDLEVPAEDRGSVLGGVSLVRHADEEEPPVQT